MMTAADPADSPSQGTDNSPPADPSAHTIPQSNSDVPKPKRLACMICRKRKLRCDGTKPSCSTCTRLGHSCAYDEVRKKSGPKRGYVKALEERLRQVEELLSRTQEPSNSTSPDATMTSGVAFDQTRNQQATVPAGFNVTNSSMAITGDRDLDRWRFNGESPQGNGLDDFNFPSNVPMNLHTLDPSFTWEMIGLGLEEPLPPQETIDELHQVFFEKVHPSLPMIHKFRYLAAMSLAPNQRPPVALRYAIWTLACSVTDKYKDLTDLFYKRSRKYVETDAIKGFASYEFKMMYFPRAWMSTGAAVRLAQMVGLHRIDGNGLEVKQCLPPPRDWTETEERRRTFWMAFCQDRYASIGTGWPMTIDERDIITNLPSSEEAFNLSRPEVTQTLVDAMNPVGAAKLSAFGGVVLMATLFGRNLTHLHRPDPNDRDEDLNGEFWKRHRFLDNVLLNTSLYLPNQLKLPAGLSNPNNVFTNMKLHTSTICLHQAAIFKADRNRLPSNISSESKFRCITAANEIAHIMRMASHMDLSAMNPFIAFCLYVSARVFVQYLKSRPDDGQTVDSLRFLLVAMNALKKKNPLTESFLVQLDVDLDALGMRMPKLRAAFPRSTDSPTMGNDSLNFKSRPDENIDKSRPRQGVDFQFDDSHKSLLASYEKAKPVGAPKVIEPERQQKVHDGAHTNPFETQTWYPEGQPIPSHARCSGTDNTGSDMGMSRMIYTPYIENQARDANNVSESPKLDGGSDQQIPNSRSNATDHRQSVANTMASSSGVSFNVSSIGSQQNLGVQGMGSNTPRGQFFQNLGFDTCMTPGQTFGMPETSGNTFSMPSCWGTEQAGMTPRTAEALMHGLNMPMDGVEMSWDAGT